MKNKLQEKEETIEFLRAKISSTVQDLQKEVDQREEIINSRISVIK